MKLRIIRVSPASPEFCASLLQTALRTPKNEVKQEAFSYLLLVTYKCRESATVSDSDESLLSDAADTVKNRL